MLLFTETVLLLTIAYFTVFQTFVNGAFADNEPRFKLIGTRQGGHFDERNYYASTLAGIWSTAITDCQSTFGQNGHLVSIEDEEESDSIKEWLDYRGSGGATFWTSGQYTVNSGDWIWAGGQEGSIIQFTDWYEGQPLENPNDRHRIGLKHSNQFSAGWVAIFDSETRRYICEVNTRSLKLTSTNEVTSFTTTEPIETATADC